MMELELRELCQLAFATSCYITNHPKTCGLKSSNRLSLTESESCSVVSNCL